MRRSVAILALLCACIPELNLSDCLEECNLQFDECSGWVIEDCGEDEACLTRGAQVCLSNVLTCTTACVEETEDQL